jgi:two-component system, NtrC family, sensor histidine kinase HydH
VSFPRWLQFIRPQDLVWLVLFSVMAALSPERNPHEVVILFCLAVFQVIEWRIPFLMTPRGNIVAILIKLALGYLLIGYTGGVISSYYLILLLPVMSAATSRGILGTALFTLLACASYLSFLLPVFFDWDRYLIPPDQVYELGLRVAFLSVVGYLTHRLAESTRVEARKHQVAAEQLAAAQLSLQAAEAAVRRSERLAALGQLTAGLAHELRNPLGTIKASSEMLLKGVAAENEVTRELAGFISTEVDRTNQLVSRFLEFARPFHLRKNPSDIGEVIDRAVAQLEKHNPPFDVTVYKNYSPDIRPFPFDAELIEHVIYNLLLNAAQATPAGGAVTVKTLQAGSSVEIAVIDRGAVIQPRDLESIFNPFFTTKPEGVGLGLAIVSKIVDEHGGKIAVESEPAKGSVFRVDLPAGREE